MRIAAFEVRPDEIRDFHEISEKLGVDVVLHTEVSSLDNVKLVEGFDGVSTLGMCHLNRELLDAWKAAGVRYISTRTIGYNHIDVDYAKKIGIRVCNAAYEPHGVADFTIMMILMSLRNYKQAFWRGKVNDFSLAGLQGREMKDLTIGVMGTGKIGTQVIRELTGFGCRILAYDVRENEAVKEYASYVDLDTLYAESDVITLHMPLLPSTQYIINDESIAKMKDGVVLINCARGGLCNIESLITGIETEKIGALGMDTVEGEEDIIHADHRIDILANRNWFYLHQFRNVIMTQHMAFYTDAAVKSMVECGVAGIWRMAHDQNCPTEL